MWRRKRKAEPPRPAPLRILRSERLTLVAATAGLVGADLAGVAALAGALDAEVSSEWPPELFSSPVMQLIRAQLDDPAEQGWSAWYLVSREQGAESGERSFALARGRPRWSNRPLPPPSSLLPPVP